MEYSYGFSRMGEYTQEGYSSHNIDIMSSTTLLSGSLFFRKTNLNTRNLHIEPAEKVLVSISSDMQQRDSISISVEASTEKT